MELVGWPVVGGGLNEYLVIDRIFGFAPNPIEADYRVEQSSYSLDLWLPDGNLGCFAEGPATQFLLI